MALKILNCTHVIATTATGKTLKHFNLNTIKYFDNSFFLLLFLGSLKEEIKPGSIVIIDDFIDRTKSRVYTFYDGSEQSDVGVCHLPMAPACDERTRQVIIETAKEIGLHEVFEKGTVVCIEGPRFSTRAESKLYRSWGADLVGMTLSPECILAKEKGMLYASIAMATDYDCGMGDTSEGAVSVEGVMETFKKNVEKVTKLVLAVVPNIQKLDWTDTISELNSVVNSSIMLPNQYSK